MYLSSSTRLLFVASALLLTWSTSVLAAATVSVTPTGDKSYSVQGSGMDGVSGIQLDIKYDSTSLAAPTVTQGTLVSGAMLAANTTLPGIIKIAIISTRSFSGSGQIASISFASKTGSGGITSITTSMIDSKGSNIASSTNNPGGTENSLSAGIPFSQPSSTQQQSTSTTTTSDTASTTITSTASTATPTYLGTVTFPTDLQQKTDPQPVPSSTAPVDSGRPIEYPIAEQTKPSGKSAIDRKVEETHQLIVYKGISERFKLYKGKRDLSTMVTLFAKNVVQTVQQEPSILLSDGKSKATLTVDIPAKTVSSPSFAVNGGKLISFQQDKQKLGRWIIEVLPDVAAVRTTVAIIAGAEEFEFPLTVTPPIKTTLTLDDQGWNRFLKEVGTAKKPLHDLNNDGMRDYVDEFIFVANHLAKKTAPLKPVSTPKKSAK